MKKIEIITHCQAIERPVYEALLTYQLSSLILHYPKTCSVIISVCYTPEDKLTKNVLDFFIKTGMNIQTFEFSPHRLGRRAIGRNVVAKASKADLVWFTDVDYIFHEGCLDNLASLEWPDGASMIFPRDGMIHKDHKTGIQATDNIKKQPQVIDIYTEDFIEMHHKKPIGGIQIIQGDTARNSGYCDESTLSDTPTLDGTFASCVCDIRYRALSRKRGKLIDVDIPGLFRIRHAKRKFKDRTQKIGYLKPKKN